MKYFNTGAYRDGDENKIDYEGFLSPAVLERFGKYMLAHQKQSDGKMRTSDNWQAGIPQDVYMKSLLRHTFQLWGVHRGNRVVDDKGELIDKQDALCAIIFNAQGYLFEDLKKKNK
jgi:hypothetical protein